MISSFQEHTESRVYRQMRVFLGCRDCVLQYKFKSDQRKETCCVKKMYRQIWTERQREAGTDILERGRERERERESVKYTGQDRVDTNNDKVCDTQ